MRQRSVATSGKVTDHHRPTHTTRLLPNVPRLFCAHISMYPRHLSHPFSYAENSLTQKSHRNTQHSQTAPPQLVLKATHCQQYVLSLTIFNLDQQCAFYYYCTLIIHAFFSAIVVTSATFCLISSLRLLSSLSAVAMHVVDIYVRP